MKTTITLNQIFRNFFRLQRSSFSAVFLLFFLLFFGINAASAQTTRTTAQTGSWNSTSTWVGGVVPASNDPVRIAPGHTITVTANASCASIDLVYVASGSSSGTSTLTINSTVTLTVSGGVSMSTINDYDKTATIQGAGTLSCGSITLGTDITINTDQSNTLNSTITSLICSGNLTIRGNDDSSSEHDAFFNLQSGTLEVSQISITSEGGNADADLLLNSGSENATLKISGATPFTTSGTLSAAELTITLNGTSSTIEYNRAGTQTVLNTSYTNLTLSGSGAKTLANFDVSNKLSIQGTATITGTSVTSVGTLEYKGSSAQTTTNTEFPSSSVVSNVIVHNAANVTLNAAKTISGTLTMTSGTLNMANNNLTVGSISGSTNITNTTGTAGARTLSIGSDNNSTTYSGVISNGTATSVALTKTGNGTLTLSGANTYTGATTITDGTIEYGASNVMASPVTLNGGTLSTGSEVGYSDACGTLTMTASSTINLGTGNHNLNFSASNTVSWTASTILTITGWTGSYASSTGSSGTQGKIFVGTTSSGLTAGQLGQIRFFDGTDYYPATIISSTGEVVPFTPTGTTYYSRANGNWNDNNTWSLTSATGTAVAAGRYPKAGDAVQIVGDGSAAAGFTVTVNSANAACASVQIGGTVAITLGTLTFAASGNPNLTVSGTITVGGSGSTNANRSGTITFVSGATLEAGSIVLTQSTSGGSNDNPGTITMTSGSTLITGSLAVGEGTTTWTPSTGNVILKSNNTLPSTVFTSFNNLTISGGTTTLGAAITVANDLTINSGTTLTPGSNGITISGDFVNSGTMTSGSGGLTITGTATTQTIDGFTTTGTVSMTKTAGTATFNGNVNGAGLTINGSGGTLNLGSGLSHTFTGTWTRTNGTLQGGSSLLKIGGNVSGTAGTFTANTGTVEYYGAAQTAAVVTYNNLTLSGSLAKTFATTPTVNGVLSLEGTASVTVTTGVVTYGTNATLQYNKAASYTATSEEWITPFVATGGIIIMNTGAITTPRAVQVGNNTNVPLNINTGATLTPGANLITLHGDFIESGTLTSGSGGVTIAGTVTAQSIDGFTTTGTVSMTKTAGTATFNGNVNGGALTMSGNGGTLNLGSGLSHTFTGTWTRTNGTLNGGSSTLNLSATPTATSGTGGTFTAGTGTVNYSAAGNQTLALLAYNNLTLSGSGVKTIGSTTTIAGNLSIAPAGTATASLNAGTTYTVSTLTLGGVGKNSGTWGSTTATTATNQTNTYFAATTGRVSVTNDSRPTLTVTATGPSKTYGTALTAGASATNFTVTGTLASEESLTSVTLTPNAAGLSATTAAGAAYVVTPSAATGTGGFLASNYNITYTAFNGTVSTKALTITASNATKTYGTTQSTPVTGSTAFTSSGLVGSETIGSVTLTYGAGALTANAAVGSTSTITPGSAIGGTFTASNYSITYATGTLTVGAISLTVTATGPSKTYGTALTAGASATNFTVTGTLASGESLTSVTLTPNAAGLSATTAAGAAYVVTPSAATGTGGFLASNYNITYTAFNGTVSTKALTITANNQTNCAGTTFTFAGTEFTTSGLVNGDTVSSATLTSTGSASNATANTYPIVANNALGTGLANYTISYLNGTLTVNASPTATDTTICPGGSGSLTVSSSCTDITGQTSGPNDAGTGSNLTGVGSTAWSNPGNITAVGSPYATVAPAQQGTSNYLFASNYGFSIPANAIINGIQLTISRSSTQSLGTGNRDNHVKLVKSNVLQDANKAVGGVYPTGLTNQSYGNATDLWDTTWTAADINNSGFGAVLSVFNTRIFGSATATVDFMQITVTYTIPGSFEWYTVSSGGTAIGSGSTFNPVGVANSGLANTNTAGTTSYWVACSTAEGSCRTKADFIINALPTVTSATGNSKTYTGIANATTVSAVASAGATIDWYDASTGGTLLASGTLTYAPTGINAGTYTVFAQARNTSTGCTSAARTSATLTINKAVLTITAGSQTVPYGTAANIVTGAGTYTATGFVNSETSAVIGGSATYTTTYTATTAAATSGVTITPVVTGLTATNYSFSAANGAITISTAALTVTATGPSKTYGTALTAGASATNFTVTGTLASGESLTSVTLTPNAAGLSATTAAGAAYVVTPSAATGTGGFLASNYNITYTAFSGTVSTKALTITASNATKTYGTTQSTPVTGSTAFTSSGLVGSETIGSVTLTYGAGALTANAAVGSTSTITPGSAIGGTFTASNYSITYATGTLTVGTISLTVTATGPSKTYGTALTAGASATNFTVTGTLASGESLTSVTLTPDAAGLSATTAAGAAYVVTPSAATGTGGFLASNYNITYTAFNGTVSTKALTITASNATKCFGETYTLENTAFTSSGLQNGETIGSVTLTSSGVSSDAAAASYSIVPSAATGGTFTASNYSINYVNGSLVVNPVSVGGTVAGGGTVCSGTNSTVLTLSGHTGSITRWESSLDNFATLGTTIANTTATLTATNLAATTSYRAVVTSGACTATNSATATVTISSSLVAPTSATANVTTICGSGSTTLTLTGGGSQDATVKWYTSSCGGTLVGTGNGLVVSPTSTTTYYGRYEGSCDTTSCASVTITFISATTTTWNGTEWSNGAPTASSAAIISGTFTSPGTNPSYNLRACKLTVNAGATVLIKSGDNVILDGALIATPGSFVTFNSGANLIQFGTTNDNTGAIVIKRESSSLLKRLDYTLWSSPVAGQGLQAFSPNTLSNRFYSYNSSTDLYQAVNPSATSFSPFNGYLIRTPNTHPTTPASWTGQFTGVPNNGNYSMAFTGYRVIGNPYPSAIDADAFIEANISINGNDSTFGTIYFWRKTNGSLNGSYITKTLGGVAGDRSILNQSQYSSTPNNVIQVGQGFIVRGTGTSDVVFTNDMRTDSRANRFFRTANTIERNRIWLNITNAAGSFSQAMIAYMTGATQGVDNAIDGELLTDGDVYLASLIGTKSYTIQGRALPFNMTDVVPMIFKVTTAGEYTITIDSVDGLFSNGAQTVYLRDNTTGVVHNLSAGAYTFTSASGTFDTRFEIVYRSSLAVSTPVVSSIVGSYIYNGSPQGPNTATNTGTGTSYTFIYEGTGSTTYAASSIAPTNAGTYTVTTTVEATGNYASASSIATPFTIVAATPVVTSTVESYTYSGSPQGPNAATNTGTGTSYTFIYEGTGSTTYAASSIAPTNAGAYTVTATVEATGNYASASSSATPFTIEAATPVVTSTVESYTYSGSPKGPDAATNTGTGTSYTFIYEGTGSTTYAASSIAPTNAGTYTVTTTVEATGNYASASSSATVFTIEAATPVVTSTVESYTYSGSPQGPDAATNTGTGTSYTFIYEGTGSTTYAASSIAPTNAGAYTVTTTVEATGNYASASSSATPFTIEAATPIVTSTVESYTYSGSPQGPDAATNTGTGTSYAFIYEGTGSTAYAASPIAPTNAGTYTVTATVEATGNYASASSSATVFTISAKPLTITALDYSKCEGVNYVLPSNGYSIEGLVGSQSIDNVTLSSAGNPSNSVVGTYPIVAQNAIGGSFNNSNYSITYIDGTLTVDPLSVGGTASASSTSVISGNSTTITLTGYTGAIQWQSSNDGDSWTDEVGATQNTYTTPALTETVHYRALVTSGECSSMLSSSVVIAVDSAALAVPTFNESQVVIYKTPTNEISINTGNVVMSMVKIFDIRGRLLQEQKNINASQTFMNAGLTTEVLLVQITSEEGVVVTKKVLFPRTSLKLDKNLKEKTQLAEDE